MIFSACSIIPELHRSDNTRGFMYWNDGILKEQDGETTFLEIKDFDLSINKNLSNYRLRGRISDRKSGEWITGKMGAFAFIGEIVIDTTRTFDEVVMPIHRIITKETFAIDDSGRVDATFSLKPNESFFITCIGCTLIEYSGKK